MPDGWVFGTLYRMFLYHWEYPYQYIASVSIVYGLLATPLSIRFRRNQNMSFLIYSLGVALVILVASPIGGMLWVIHDMQAGYFTEGARFRDDLMWGALEGLRSGWLVILLSMPYNIFGLIAGYFITNHGFKRVGLDQIHIVKSLPSLSSLGETLPPHRGDKPGEPNR